MRGSCAPGDTSSVDLREVADACAPLLGGASLTRAEFPTLHHELVEDLPLVTYIDRLDAVSSAVYMSPQVETLLGYAPDEWTAEPELFVNLLHPSDRERVLEEHRRTRETGAPLASEYRLIARDGRELWFRDRAMIVVDEGTGEAVLQGYLLDITEQKAIEEELRRRTGELDAGRETALSLIEGLDLATVLETIVKRASELLRADHGYLYLVEPEGEALELGFSTGLFAGERGEWLKPGQGLAGRVWVSRSPLAIEDYSTWEGRDTRFESHGFHATAGVPLLSEGEVTGVLGLAHVEPGRVFGPTELEVLDRFARLASLALTNARLYSAMAQELAERQQVEEELRDAVARVRRSELELALSREEMIRRLSAAAEFRDTSTGRHIERMGHYCALLADRLGLDEDRVELIRLASPLHDVGKIGVPDSVLLKPGPLTPDEREVIERHAEIGHSMLAGSGSPLLELAATIARTHHERFDGAGYPHGLAGEEIPLEGRIASVADVFDALTSDRPYRPGFSLPDALAMMKAGRGTQFDPLLLDLFLESLGEVVEIGQTLMAAPALEVVGIAADVPEGRLVTGRGAGGRLRLRVLRAAADAALATLREASPGRYALETALARLRDAAGPELLASVYIRENDRLWLVAQSGYEQVRDGFTLDQGVMARAIRTGSAQFVADVNDDPDFISAVQAIQSELALPLGSDGPAVGALNLETRGRQLPPGAERAFTALADELGSWVAALSTGVASDLPSLAHVFAEASGLRSVTSIAEFASRTLGRLLDLESAQVNLARSGSGYSLASFWRRPESLLKPLDPEEVDRVGMLVEPGGTTSSIVNTSPDRWLIWLPLRAAGQEIGALIGSGPEQLDLRREDAEAATLFAQHAAALIDGAQALQREQRAAVTDSLTGLLNRRGFHERFREDLQRAERLGRELSVVVLDCDDLKAVNDYGGHAVGDAALQRVGRILKSQKRLEDVAGRIGGDEFALLLPELGAAAALTVVERLRNHLSDRDVEGGAPPLTGTFGIATFPADGADLGDLLNAADRAMYMAKAQGKNRTLSLHAVASA
jgi:diguanylate cyclase (GGDEF)-like protein/PAS domain S-box-containing protein